MRPDVERSSRKWVVVAAGLLAVLAAGLVVASRTTPITDVRLVGTWQSDADRTIASIRERRPVDDKQEAALRTVFGKLRLTYTPSTYTTELDGTTETCKFNVLGKDKHSAVIRELERKPSPLDALEISEFTVIQFDGPDAYWVHTKIGDIREYADPLVHQV